MRAKIVSSMEKCFLDENVLSKPELSSISMLKNERYSFQVCFDIEEAMSLTESKSKKIVYFKVESPLKEYIHMYQVKNIPSEMPVIPGSYDSNYLRTEPGLYPDLLQPMDENTRLPARNALLSIWLELDPQGAMPAGSYPIKGIFTNESGNVEAEVSIEVEIINANLPEQDLIYTQWFYTDCLMQYYNTTAFSDEHWRIIENFMVNAHKYGQTMILTPVLSPELDTYVGGYRPATQLVDITVENGEYQFYFSKLGRWVDLCNKVGIQYFEINHFFSQWGAKACPQVYATVDGEKKRIFGWDTPSDSAEYKAFLGALIPALLAYMKSKDGADQRCRFHVSDEPTLESLDRYSFASGVLKPLLEGYPMMDALSRYEFYELGLVDCPIPATHHIEPFLEHNVKNLWTYYCIGPSVDASNRFFAMPGARTRIIGTQFYKFEIAGFLHWGYNFYNSQYSYLPINPFLCSDGECFAPSGDTYSVYPGTNGEPWPSLRQVLFAEAIQDQRALKLCESLYGREYTMKLLEDGIEPITFMKYPQGSDYILHLRKRVNDAIKAKVGA